MSIEQWGANWDEVGADGMATKEELLARIMELATGARTAVVTIGGLVCGARNNGVGSGPGAVNATAREFLDQIDQAALELASLLPENATTVASLQEQGN